MFWSFDHEGKSYYSWGEPKELSNITNLKPDFNVKIYNNEKVNKNDKILYILQGSTDLGLGDSMWLISYLRDVYNIIGKRKVSIDIYTNKRIHELYKTFLPKNFCFKEEFIEKEKIKEYDHIIPTMYYWKEKDNSDKSWIDNKSILERLYDMVGIEYNGLPDWSNFTPDHILYPNDDFYNRLGIDKNDDYIFYQWHSSGFAKNLPPKTNIKIIKHLLEKFPNKKIYLISMLDYLNKISDKFNRVINLSNKTNKLDLFSLASNADLIVGPDSVCVHLGEAYKIPTVGIFSVLPPVYVAKNYKFPSFMFGSGKCPFAPCGHVDMLPKNKCPDPNKKFCQVLDDINLDIFDKCIEKTFKKVEKYKRIDNINFYESMDKEISL